MRFIAVLICSVFVTGAFAQQDLMLYNSTKLWHRNSQNPAFYPKGKILNVGLPAFSLDAAHSGTASFDDAIIDQNGQNVFDFSLLLDKLDAENQFYFDNRIETLSFGFNLPAGFKMNVGHAIRTHMEVAYPKELPEILWNGNAQFIGQTVNIAPQMNIHSLNELGLGFAKSVGPLTVGARFKVLTGLGSARTDRSTASVYTDPDIYQLSLTTDYDIYSSSFIDVVDLADDELNIESGEVDFRMFGANGGTAFDLGLTYQVSDKIELSASVLDLGGTIKWSENANRFHSEGTYTYEGVVLPGKDFIDGSSNLDVGTELDTLSTIFNFQSSENKEFETDLPARFYVGGNFRASDKWRFGATIYNQGGTLYEHTQVGINAEWTPLRWVALSTMYSLNRESAANLGFGIALTPGPVQLYLMSDHVINAFTPTQRGDVNFRLGMALSFGSPKEKIANVTEEILD